MWLTKRLGVAGGLCTLALLTGCASSHTPPVLGAVHDAPTPLDKFEIGSHEAPDQVGLGVHPEGVSGTQREALAAFADRWRAAGSGWVTIQTPNDCPEPGEAKAYAESAIATLSGLGVPYDHIRIIGYAAGPSPKAVVLASFTRTVVDAPDCRSIPWDNLTATKDNKPYARYGCTLVANMAVQIADPSDLRGDRPMSPADNTRRMVVLDKYRQGKVTSSDKDDQASGAVSTAVKQ